MPTVPAGWAESAAIACAMPPPKPRLPVSVGPTGGEAAAWLVKVTSPATIALPGTNTAVSPVRPTFSPLMVPGALLVRLLDAAERGVRGLTSSRHVSGVRVQLGRSREERAGGVQLQRA